MRPGAALLTGLATVWAVCSASAGADEPLREAQSENGRFYVRIRAGRPGVEAVRGCKATLYERAPESKRAHQTWERFLVNDVAPQEILIRNDGRFLVTLDEFGCGGARHALVIYGEHGELLRHFILPDLLSKDDWPDVRVDKRSIDWRSGAKVAFVDGPPQLAITLKSGRRIAIDLKTLCVVRPAGSQATPGDAIPAEALAAMAAALQAPDEPAAKRDGLTLELSTTQPADAPTSQSSAPALTTRPMPPKAPADSQSEAPVENSKREVVAVPPAPPKPSANTVAASTSLPRPDPTHRVDYVAWANEQMRAAGPNAAAAYDTAIAALVPADADVKDLQAAAMGGDGEALASPALQGWLDANQDAVARFRDAAQLDFHGWELRSDDGALIGATLPNLARVRQLATLTILDGRRLESEGFATGAADQYVDALSAGAHISHGPTLIENLVGTAMQLQAAQALLDLPAGPAAARADYRRLAAQLETTAPTRPLAESMELERATFMDTLQRAYEPDRATGGYVASRQWGAFLSELSADDESGEEGPQLPAQLSPAEFNQIVDRANAAFDSAGAAARLPYPAAQRALEAVESRLDGSAGITPALHIMFPSFTHVHLVKTRAEANRRAAILVTNLMAYHQQHGAYPPSLRAFDGQEFATDPFTSQPFHYRVTADGFSLYSLGANGADDGGIHDPKGETNDMVFWPRPK